MRPMCGLYERSLCLSMSCCDYPPPVCGLGLGHIGQWRIVQGMENVRDASFKEKCSRTPRLGPDHHGIPCSLPPPPLFAAYPRITQVHTVEFTYKFLHCKWCSLYSQLSRTNASTVFLSARKYCPWIADLDVEQLVYYCCRTVRVDVNTIFQLLFLLWG